jgi:hypothetical protein
MIHTLLKEGSGIKPVAVQRQRMPACRATDTFPSRPRPWPRVGVSLRAWAGQRRQVRSGPPIRVQNLDRSTSRPWPTLELPRHFAQLPELVLPQDQTGVIEN